MKITLENNLKLLSLFALLFLLVPSTTAGVTIDKITGTAITGDFLVTPVRHEILILPGETKTIEFSVLNRTGEDRAFELSFDDFRGTRDEDRPIEFINQSEVGFHLSKFIFAEEREFTLKHSERAKIKVTVSLPDGVEPGGLSTAINVSSRATENGKIVEGSKALIIPRVSVLLLAEVEGESISSGELKSFSLKGSNVMFDNRVPEFRILFDNSGTKHLNPYGFIEVTDFRGNLVDSKEIEPWFVLPDSLKTREVSLNKSLGLGKYKVVLKMNRGYEDIVDEKQLTFYVLPKSFVVVILLTLILLVFSVKFLRGRTLR